jgi:hypothetical protein
LAGRLTFAFYLHTLGAVDACAQCRAAAADARE